MTKRATLLKRRHSHLAPSHRGHTQPSLRATSRSAGFLVVFPLQVCACSDECARARSLHRQTSIYTVRTWTLGRTRARQSTTPLAQGRPSPFGGDRTSRGSHTLGPQSTGKHQVGRADTHWTEKQRHRSTYMIGRIRLQSDHVKTSLNRRARTDCHFPT